MDSRRTLTPRRQIQLNSKPRSPTTMNRSGRSEKATVSDLRYTISIFIATALSWQCKAQVASDFQEFLSSKMIYIERTEFCAVELTDGNGNYRKWRIAA